MRYARSFRLLFTALLLSGCPSENGTPFFLFAPPAETGYIKGFVIVYDEFGSPMTDRSGVRVALKNADSVVAISDASGMWKLGPVGAGVYHLNFSKDGFGNYEIPSLQFLGRAEYYVGEQWIVQRPSFTLETLTVTPFVKDGLHFLRAEGMTTRVRSEVILICGMRPDVSADPAKHQYAWVTRTNQNDREYSGAVNEHHLLIAGFQPGDTVYIVAYPTSRSTNVTYPDPETGRRWYSAIGTTHTEFLSVVF